MLDAARGLVRSAAMKNEPSAFSGLPMCSLLRKLLTSLRRRWIAPVIGAGLRDGHGRAPWPISSAVPGGPFPCQGHRCGCVSAEQCWGHCCCFTPEQRLAWAAANRSIRPLNSRRLCPTTTKMSTWRPTSIRSSTTILPRPMLLLPQRCRHMRTAGVAPPGERQEDRRAWFPSLQMPRDFHAVGDHRGGCSSVAPVAWTFDWSIVGTVPTLRYPLSAVAFLPAVPPPRA